MKIETNILILKTEIKTNKDNQDYLMISFADTQDGNTYNVICKDMSYSALKPFGQYKGIFTLNSSKYGLNLAVDSIEQQYRFCRTTKERYKEGRPKAYTKEQLENALSMLTVNGGKYSYKEVEKLLNISKSTLIRENNKRKSANL